MTQEELDKMGFQLEKVLEQIKSRPKGAAATKSGTRVFEVSQDGVARRKRGRPRRMRPAKDDFEALSKLGRHPSIRDIAAVLGMSRQKVSDMCELASLPKKEWEKLLGPLLETGQIKEPSRQFALLARSRAGKAAYYERRCPHCGELLRVEGLSRRLRKLCRQ